MWQTHSRKAEQYKGHADTKPKHRPKRRNMRNATRAATKLTRKKSERGIGGVSSKSTQLAVKYCSVWLSMYSIWSRGTPGPIAG